MEKKKLKKGDRVWVRLPINATIKSVNQKFGYTLSLDVVGGGEMAQYFDDDEVEKI